MFLALRELQHSYLRYLLLGVIITLIAWLAFLLSGLANGLSTDNASTVQRMPADYFVFKSDARTQMGRSLLPQSTVAQVRQTCAYLGGPAPPGAHAGWQHPAWRP